MKFKFKNVKFLRNLSIQHALNILLNKNSLVKMDISVTCMMELFFLTLGDLTQKFCSLNKCGGSYSNRQKASFFQKPVVLT